MIIDKFELTVYSNSIEKKLHDFRKVLSDIEYI